MLSRVTGSDFLIFQLEISCMSLRELWGAWPDYIDREPMRVRRETYVHVFLSLCTQQVDSHMALLYNLLLLPWIRTNPSTRVIRFFSLLYLSLCLPLSPSR